MKLTKAQTVALRRIQNHPRMVAAYTRTEPDLLTIHGNVEDALLRKGLIHEVSAYSRTRLIEGRSVHYNVSVWALTPAGYEALAVSEGSTAQGPAKRR